MESVLAAMSGGVDSSLAAALLKAQGLKVVGVTLLLQSCGTEEGVNKCCGTGAVGRAGAVAGLLGIPHYSLGCVETFESEVLKAAWEEYARGRTPNPCIHCNARVKFKLLADLADKLGLDKIATGHYARLLPGGPGSPPRLFMAGDRSKDQSYYLFSLSPLFLERTLFPLGELSKNEVRRLARKMGLPAWEAPDSQDACVEYPGLGFSEGLRRKFGAPAEGGPIVDTRRRVIGRHEGIHRFTIGQRKGLGVALGRRAYVVDIDPGSRRVVLSSDPADLEKTSLEASGVNWLQGLPPAFPLRCEARIRSRHLPQPAIVAGIGGGRVEVRFSSPQRAVTPGQAVVFYKGEEVLGGGWIDGPGGGEETGR